jgi:predicted PurR-regulated permease PerM
MLFAFSLLGGTLWLGAVQLADIVEMVPSYQANIHRKIEAMRNPAGSALAKVDENIAKSSAEFSTPTGASELVDHPSPSVRKTKLSAVQSRVEPVRVELVQHHFGVVESIGLVGTSIAHFAEMAGGVPIFTLFMLMQRNDLRNRLFRLLGQGHLNVMTTPLDDAASRVSKYLFTQSLINGSFGLCTGFGLYCLMLRFGAC